MQLGAQRERCLEPAAVLLLVLLNYIIIIITFIYLFIISILSNFKDHQNISRCSKETLSNPNSQTFCFYSI